MKTVLNWIYICAPSAGYGRFSYPGLNTPHLYTCGWTRWRYAWECVCPLTLWKTRERKVICLLSLCGGNSGVVVHAVASQQGGPGLDPWVQMFCLCWFPLSFPVSFHSPKRGRLGQQPTPNCPMGAGYPDWCHVQCVLCLVLIDFSFPATRKGKVT